MELSALDYFKASMAVILAQSALDRGNCAAEIGGFLTRPVGAKVKGGKQSKKKVEYLLVDRTPPLTASELSKFFHSNPSVLMRSME